MITIKIAIINNINNSDGNNHDSKNNDNNINKQNNEMVLSIFILTIAII